MYMFILVLKIRKEVLILWEKLKSNLKKKYY